MRWRAILALLLWVGLRGVSAHPMPESRMWIDTDPGGLRLTLEIPLNRLEFAVGLPLADAPQDVLPRHEQALAAYLLQHVGARSGQQGWQVLRPTLRVTGMQDRNAELVATMRLVAPAGADPRKLDLLLDAVTHEVRTHRILVFLRNDWMAGIVSAPPQPVGQFDAVHTAISLDLAPPRTAAAVRALSADGALHIATGSDHLLFLLLLLMAAPSTRVARRWGPPRPPRLALRHVAWVVSAFTLGHSLTLALGSLGLVPVPAQWVEVAIAVTIGVAAIHAWRPLFSAAESWMALGFGLIHGLAFSSGLSGAGLTVGQHALALLAFNGGIEAMQLALVALVLPPLLSIAWGRPRWFERLRRAVVVVALPAAVWWAAERLGLMPEEAVVAIPDPATWWPGMLPVLWLVGLWARRRAQQQESGEY